MVSGFPEDSGIGRKATAARNDRLRTTTAPLPGVASSEGLMVRPMKGLGAEKTEVVAGDQTRQAPGSRAHSKLRAPSREGGRTAHLIGEAAVGSDALEWTWIGLQAGGQNTTGTSR